MIRHALILLVILGATLFTYYWSLDSVFQYDDYRLVVDNHNFRDGRLGLIVGHTVARPFLILSLYHSYSLAHGSNTGGEIDPRPFHWTNLILHMLTIVCVYLLIQEALKFMIPEGDSTARWWTVPIFATSLFALHPLQTQSVTYISSRSDLQCTLFIFASLLCFIRFRVRFASVPRASQRRWFWAILPYVSLAGIFGMLLTVFHEGLDPQKHLVTAFLSVFWKSAYQWFAAGSVGSVGAGSVLMTRLDLLRWVGLALWLSAAAAWVLAGLWWREKQKSGMNTLTGHGWILASLCFFVLAMGSKELAIITPILVIAFDRLIIQRKYKATVTTYLGYAPMLVICLAAVIVWLVIYGDQQPDSTYTTGDYFKTQGVVLWKYIGMFLYPLGQALDHTVTSPALWIPDGAGWIIGYAALAMLLAIALWKMKRWPVFALCVIWYLAGSAPTSWFKSFPDPMFEHRLYLVMPALTILMTAPLVFAFQMVKRSSSESFLLKTTGVSIAAAILLCFSSLTLKQNELYNTPTEMWRNVAEHNPTSPRSLSGLAFGLLTASRAEMSQSPNGIDALMLDSDLSKPEKKVNWSQLGWQIYQTNSALRHAETLFHASYAMETDNRKVTDICNNIAQVGPYRSMIAAHRAHYALKSKGANVNPEEEKAVQQVIEKEIDLANALAYRYWSQSLGMSLTGIESKASNNLGMYIERQAETEYHRIQDQLGHAMSDEVEATALQVADYFRIARDLQRDTWTVDQGQKGLFPALARCYYYLAKLELGKRIVTNTERFAAYEDFHLAMYVFSAYPAYATLAEDKRMAKDCIAHINQIDSLLPRGTYPHRKIRIPSWLDGNVAKLMTRRNIESHKGIKDNPAAPRTQERVWSGTGRAMDPKVLNRAIRFEQELQQSLGEAGIKALPGAAAEALQGAAKDRVLLEQILHGKPIDEPLPYRVLGRFCSQLGSCYSLMPDRRMKETTIAYHLLQLSFEAYAVLEQSEVDQLPAKAKADMLVDIRSITGRMKVLEADLDRTGLNTRPLSLPSWAKELDTQRP